MNLQQVIERGLLAPPQLIGSADFGPAAEARAQVPTLPSVQPLALVWEEAAASGELVETAGSLVEGLRLAEQSPGRFPSGVLGRPEAGIEAGRGVVVERQRREVDELPLAAQASLRAEGAV